LLKTCVSSCSGENYILNVSVGYYCVPNASVANGQFEIMTTSAVGILSATIAASAPLLLAGTDPTVAVAFMQTL
jgi:hypothetical protein